MLNWYDNTLLYVLLLFAVYIIRNHIFLFVCFSIHISPILLVVSQLQTITKQNKSGVRAHYRWDGNEKEVTLNVKRVDRMNQMVRQMYNVNALFPNLLRLDKNH